jgi:hypothetical protein
MANAARWTARTSEDGGKYGAEQQREIGGENRGKSGKNRGEIACLAKSHY